MVASAVVFLVSFLAFASTLKLRYFLLFTPLLLVYLHLFFRKTLQEKEVMEEPESLFLHPLIAISTLTLFLLFTLSFFL